MTDSEQKAQATFAEAEKKSKSGGGGFLGGLFGGGKGEDAAELYVKAANLWKIAKNWNQAGAAFVKSAELQMSRNDAKHNAASNFVDASNCYRKTSPQHAIDCLMKAADIYTDMGRFTMAAKHHTTIAEIYESEEPNLEKSIVHYEKAADFYKGEESKSAAHKCLLKVAQYAAQLEQYKKAITIYEEVGKSCADSSLLKYSAKDYFFRALLCHLCVDVMNAQQALKRTVEMCPSFADTREAALIKELISCLEDQNAENFTNTVKNYDKISRLDEWHTMMLVRLKRTCGEEGDGDDMR